MSRLASRSAAVVLSATVLTGCGGTGRSRLAAAPPAHEESATTFAPVGADDRRSPRVRGRAVLNCATPARGARWLPAACSRGPIQYLRQYPAIRLASPGERREAGLLLEQTVAAAEAGSWSDLRAIARAGYETRTARRRPGDRSLHFFHAERSPEPRPYGTLKIERPKALIFANAPGRPLVLVGAMWSMRPGERGPTPGGPITRWHSHLVCSDGRHRGTEPPSSGRCPAGMHLHHGRVEMMHIWLTGDLRSAFAIRAPQPELCAADLLPAGHCALRSGARP